MKTRTIDTLFFLLIAVMVILASSCSKKHIPTVARADTIVKTIVEEKIRDTTIYISDSAGMRAYLECDSAGRVRIREITDYYAGQMIKPKVVIRDNYLTADCRIDSAAVALSWTERNVTQTTATSQTIIVKENYLTGWQWFQVWMGRILGGILLLFIIYRLIKLYTKIQLPF